MRRFAFWRRWMTVKEFRDATVTVARARRYAKTLEKCLNRLNEHGMDMELPPLNERGHRTIEIVERETSKTLAVVEEWPLLGDPWAVDS
jgi:hypothetical protein